MARKGVPSGRCTICAHVERGRIDWLAAGGAPLLPLAEQFGVGRDALVRHFENHVTDHFKQTVKIGPFQDEEQLRKLCAQAGTSVLENLQANYAMLASRALVAYEAGADAALASLQGRINENLRMQAQISKEIAPPPASLTINAVTAVSWFDDLAMELVKEAPDVAPRLRALLDRRVEPLRNVTPPPEPARP